MYVHSAHYFPLKTPSSIKNMMTVDIHHHLFCWIHHDTTHFPFYMIFQRLKVRCHILSLRTMSVRRGWVHNVLCVSTFTGHPFWYKPRRNFFAISFRTSHAFVMATLIYHMEEIASCLVCPVTLHDVAQ